MEPDRVSQASDLQSLLRTYAVPLVLGGVSVVFIFLSITIFIKSYQTVQPINFSGDVLGEDMSATSSGEIIIDIEGAVLRPGVYRLSPGARVDVAILAAGGLSKDADTDGIARTINRAAVLKDGAKLFVPVRESVSRAATEARGDAVVHINAATTAELEALPGIGPVTAEKIIAGRPYMRMEELVEKKVLNATLYEKLASYLTL